MKKAISIMAGNCRLVLQGMTLLLLLATSSTAGVAATYPDMSDKTQPADNPTLPVQMSIFIPPVDVQAPVSGTPVMAEYTRTVDAGESLALTGDAISRYTGVNNGKDTQYLAYGQTTANDAVKMPAEIMSMEANSNGLITNGIIRLPAALPDDAMYLLWPRNNAGFGRPLAINRTELWWVGPNVATRGQTVSAFGRNLARYKSTHIGTNTSWVYLKPSGGAGQWLTVTAANPNKVDFTVPASLANGTYEIWIHNGRGGEYGWSGPQTLTVNDGVQWTGGILNVQSYGVVGDGYTDDTAAINALITANRGSRCTLYFPSGTYIISAQLADLYGIRLLGDGMDDSSMATKIVAFSTIPANNHMLQFGSAGVVDISYMTIDQSAKPASGCSQLSANSSADIRLQSVRLKSGYDSALIFTSCQRILLSGCKIISPCTDFEGACKQVFLDQVDFYGTHESAVLLPVKQMREMSVTNCTAQDYDNSNPNDPAGWCMGRWFYNDTGASYHVYLGDNTTTDMSVRPACPDQNVGENVLFENTPSLGTTNSIEITGSTMMKFNNLTWSSSWDSYLPQIIVIAGKGAGQRRRYVSYNSSTLETTVDRAWDVIPDSTSTIVLSMVPAKYAIYHNSFAAKSGQYTSGRTGSTGLCIYDGGTDFIYDRNTVLNVQAGVVLRGYTNTQNGQSGWLATQPASSCLITNNTFTNIKSNVATIVGEFESLNVFRHNTVRQAGSVFNVQCDTNSSVNRTPYPGVTLPTPMTTTNIFETVNALNINSGTVGATNPYFSIIGGNAITNNIFSLGTGVYTGSLGISYLIPPVIAGLRENSYTGFQTTYGSPLSECLTLPVRVLDITIPQGDNTATGTLPIWNAGTASMNWSASADAGWIGLSSTSGTVSNENACQNITVTCTAASMNEGVNIGTVTITTAGKAYKVTVYGNKYYEGTPTVFVTSVTPGNLRSDGGDYYQGTKLTVGASPVTITHLGRYKLSGNSGTHNLLLVRASDGGAMASVNISMSGGTVGQFTYALLSSPVTLAANTAYYLGSQEQTGGDTFYEGNTVISATSVATVNGASYRPGGGGGWNLINGTNTSYVPVNFKYATAWQGQQQCDTPRFTPLASSYTAVQNVTISTNTVGATIRYTTDGTTPSATVGTVYSTSVLIDASCNLKAIVYKSGLLDSDVQSGSYSIIWSVPMVTGVTPGSLRTAGGDYYQGMKFTVGATPITVTHLGRYMLNGNYGTHSMLLVRVSDSATIASANVSMTTGAVGQYQYAELSSAVTLPAGTSYYLGCQEVTGGDTFYDGATTLSTTSVASVNGSAYRPGGGGGWNWVGGANTCYVPLDFLYNGCLKPTFSPVAGIYTSAQTMTISCGTKDTIIRYTTDGSTPSETNGTIYTMPITINSTQNFTTVKAIAYKTGCITSDVLSGNYTRIWPVEFVRSIANGNLRTDGGEIYQGFKFTVGATAINLSHMGRYMLTGNSGTHNLRLVRASNNNTIASIDITMIGGTVGQFKYVELPAVLTLDANTSYYVQSQEHDGGDSFLDGVLLTPTQAAQIDCKVWSFNCVGGANYSYGPVSFKYGNLFPTVGLTAPTAGQVYTTAPATVTLTATATDTDGIISKVEFYNGATLLNTDTVAPYTYDWMGVTAGSYTVTAKATDNASAATTSTAVNIRVNAAPIVSITSPITGGTTTAPATISITTNAADSDGTISKVEFYNNGILLGTTTIAPWNYSWTSVAASGASGISLTAKAFDNNNVSTTSAAITYTVTDSALKCFWKFNENTGASAGDSSGTNNVGTLTGTPTWTTGKISSALQFNGTSQYVTKGSATGLPTANASQTVSCWFYVTATPTVRKTAVGVTGASSGIYLGYNSATVFGAWKNGGTPLVTTTTLPTASAWHHVAYVKNGTTGNFNLLYIDGTQVATSATATNTATATTINAARTVSGADYWPGKVDEVRIYNRVLSAAEISSLAAGKQ